MRPPFVLYHHDDSRRMVVPDPYYDEITDAYGVIQRLVFIALEHHVRAEAHEWTASGSVRALEPES